jgi:peroxiredoxin
VSRAQHGAGDVPVYHQELVAQADDGAAAHLMGTAIPDVKLPSSTGPVRLAVLARNRLVLYIYPRTGRPDRPAPAGWDEIPGARGCTAQSCQFRDHAGDIAEFGARVAGLSSQSLDEQIEFATRTKMPFPIITDERLLLARRLGLPIFELNGARYYRRLALIAEEGKIVKVFYPVVAPERSAVDVVEWLRHHASS